MVSAPPSEPILSTGWWPAWLLRALNDPEHYKAPFRHGMPANAADVLDGVIQRMELLLVPAPLEAIKLQLARLLNHYKAPDRTEAEFTSMFEDLLEDLDWLSEPAMRQTCRLARRRLVFFPKSAELLPIATEVTEPIGLRLGWLRRQHRHLPRR